MFFFFLDGIVLSPILSRMLCKFLQVSLKLLVYFLRSTVLKQIPHCSCGLSRPSLFPGHITGLRFLAHPRYDHMLSSGQENLDKRNMATSSLASNLWSDPLNQCSPLGRLWFLPSEFLVMSENIVGMATGRMLVASSGWSQKYC